MENNNNETIAYIYQCNWYDTTRHKKPHTSMCFENAEDTHWVFETKSWYEDLVDVRLIKVATKTDEYKSAVKNSKITADAEYYGSAHSGLPIVKFHK